MTRAYRSLFVLTPVTILGAGVLAQALAAPAGPAADTLVVASGLLLAISATLLVRVLRYLAQPTRNRVPGPPAPARPGGARTSPAPWARRA